MVAMSTAVRISCALVVVAMAIFLATTVATSESTSTDVALTTLHSRRAPATIKRRLKRTTAMGATETSEERMFPSSIPGASSSLKSLPETILKQIQKQMSRLAPKSSDEAIQLVELNELAKLDTKKRIKLFENRSFTNLVASFEKKYPNDLEAAYEAMLETLTKQYRDDVELADELVAGTEISDTKMIALHLLLIQVMKWLETDKNEKQVFNILKLESLKERLFESPRFELWLKFFASRTRPKEYESYKSAKEAATQMADEANKSNLQKIKKLAVGKVDEANMLILQEMNSWLLKRLMRRYMHFIRRKALYFRRMSHLSRSFYSFCKSITAIPT